MQSVVYSFTNCFRACVSLLVVGGGLGCGPSDAVMEVQEEAVEREYQEAIEMPTGMTPEMRERRLKRVERNFGKRPDQ